MKLWSDESWRRWEIRDGSVANTGWLTIERDGSELEIEMRFDELQQSDELEN